MPIAPELSRFLAMIPPVDVSRIIPEEFRNLFDQLAKTIPKPVILSTKDIEIEVSEARLRARLDMPKQSKLPVILYFHGGGFVAGGIESYDPFCRKLANSSGCIIISLDYRLAPEYKFPTAVNDAIDSVRWVYANAEKLGGDKGKIAVAGDSA